MGFFNNNGASSGGEIDPTILDGKVDKVEGKGLSTNDYTTAEKTKLTGIATSANNYTHPANHPSTIITQTATARFVTDAQISAWTGKADNVGATPTVMGLVKKCESQEDSTATDIEGVVADLNSLLAKLKSAGIM